MNNGIVKRFTDKKRMLAIGDIHGCFGELIQLMEIINFNPADDVLIFLGDYIDRGYKDFETVKYLHDLRKQHPKSVFLLKGNHEDMAEAAFKNPLSQRKFGGYNEPPKFIDEDSEQMRVWKWNGSKLHNVDEYQRDFLIEYNTLGTGLAAKNDLGLNASQLPI